MSPDTKQDDVRSKVPWLELPRPEGEAGTRHLLRRKINLTEVPAEARVALTASATYRLYVNSVLVMVGPCRGTQRYLFVDDVDIRSMLRPGANVVAVEVAFFPDLTPKVLQHEFPFPVPGVGLSLDIDEGEPPLGLDERWRILPVDDAFNADSVWARGQRSEYFYAGRYSVGWMDLGFDDAGWSAVNSDHVGEAPGEFRPRPVPLPVPIDRGPVRLSDAGWLRLPDAYHDQPIPAKTLDWFGGRMDGKQAALTEDRLMSIDDLDRTQHRHVCDAISGGGLVENPSGLLHPCQGGPLVLHGHADGDAYATYDLGEMIAGMGYAEATIPRGARLEVCLLEWLDIESGGPDETRRRVCRPMCGYGGFTIEGDGERIRFDSILYNNFRYVCLVARGLNDGQRIEVHAAGATELSALHPSQVAADVTCSDPLLNRIVEATKQTIRVTSHDVFASGGTHERVVTAGDCLQASEVGRLFFGEVGRALSEATFDLFVDKGPAGIRGWPHTLAPRAGGSAGREETFLWPLAPCMLFIDMLAWAREAHERLPDRYLEAARGMAHDVNAHLGEEGLIEIEDIDTLSNWTDWSKMVVGARGSNQPGMCNAGTNAFYHRLFAELAQAVPHEPLFAELAERLRQGLQAVAGPRIASPDFRVNRFVPDMFVRDDTGKLVPFEVKEANVFGGCTVMISETTQYWMLWSGALTDEQEHRLWEVLRDWRSFEIPLRDNTRMLNPARSSSVMGLCPRFKVARQLRDSVVYRDARDAFGPNVLRENVLWESLELDSRAVVHPTTPYVGKALYECLTGILPGDGADEVRIEPVIDETIEWARGYKQVEGGLIGVSWQQSPQRFRIRIGLPVGVRAVVRLPEPVVGMLVGAGHALSDSGTIHIDQSAEILADRAGGMRVTSLMGSET
ncbi:MAG: alpha-L-rhamnosidase C-terminal domain-containing protein [Opitutales bacterium]